MADDPARSDCLRVDHRQQIVDALHTVHRSRDFNGTIVGQVAGHDSSQRGATTVRLDGEPLDANAPALQRSGDA